MPYDIRSNYGGCSGYAVVGPDGDVKGCHATRGEASAQQRALYANEPSSKVDKMMEPGTFTEGDFAMGTVDDHVYAGQIVHIMTEGMLGVEGSKLTIMASSDNPAVLIRIFEQHEDGYWKETPKFVGFDAMSGQKIDPLPMKSEYFVNGGVEKGVWSGLIDPRNARNKTF